VANLMQIISMIKHRDKAPTNALVAKSVELCAARNLQYLHYGIWSARGLGDFKKHHAFEELNIPRYYVPLTSAGKLSLALKLHKNLSERLPQKWVEAAAALRSKWKAIKLRTEQPVMGQ
jgi:hypothetical protein